MPPITPDVHRPVDTKSTVKDKSDPQKKRKKSSSKSKLKSKLNEQSNGHRNTISADKVDQRSGNDKLTKSLEYYDSDVIDDTEEEGEVREIDTKLMRPSIRSFIRRRNDVPFEPKMLRCGDHIRWTKSEPKIAYCQRANIKPNVKRPVARNRLKSNDASAGKGKRMLEGKRKHSRERRAIGSNRRTKSENKTSSKDRDKRDKDKDKVVDKKKDKEKRKRKLSAKEPNGMAPAGHEHPDSTVKRKCKPETVTIIESLTPEQPITIEPVDIKIETIVDSDETLIVTPPLPLGKIIDREPKETIPEPAPPIPEPVLPIIFETIPLNITYQSRKRADPLPDVPTEKEKQPEPIAEKRKSSKSIDDLYSEFENMINYDDDAELIIQPIGEPFIRPIEEVKEISETVQIIPSASSSTTISDDSESDTSDTASNESAVTSSSDTESTESSSESKTETEKWLLPAILNDTTLLNDDDLMSQVEQLKKHILEATAGKHAADELPQQSVRPNVSIQFTPKAVPRPIQSIDLDKMTVMGTQKPVSGGYKTMSPIDSIKNLYTIRSSFMLNPPPIYQIKVDSPEVIAAQKQADEANEKLSRLGSEPVVGIGINRIGTSPLAKKQQSRSPKSVDRRSSKSSSRSSQSSKRSKDRSVDRTREWSLERRHKSPSRRRYRSVSRSPPTRKSEVVRPLTRKSPVVRKRYIDRPPSPLTTPPPSPPPDILRPPSPIDSPPPGKPLIESEQPIEPIKHDWRHISPQITTFSNPPEVWRPPERFPIDLYAGWSQPSDFIHQNHYPDFYSGLTTFDYRFMEPATAVIPPQLPPIRFSNLIECNVEPVKVTGPPKAVQKGNVLEIVPQTGSIIMVDEPEVVQKKIVSEKFSWPFKETYRQLLEKKYRMLLERLKKLAQNQLPEIPDGILKRPTDKSERKVKKFVWFADQTIPGSDELSESGVRIKFPGCMSGERTISKSVPKPVKLDSEDGRHRIRYGTPVREASIKFDEPDLGPPSPPKSKLNRKLKQPVRRILSRTLLAFTYNVQAGVVNSREFVVPTGQMIQMKLLLNPGVQVATPSPSPQQHRIRPNDPRRWPSPQQQQQQQQQKDSPPPTFIRHNNNVILSQHSRLPDRHKSSPLSQTVTSGAWLQQQYVAGGSGHFIGPPLPTVQPPPLPPPPPPTNRPNGYSRFKWKPTEPSDQLKFNQQSNSPNQIRRGADTIPVIGSGH